MKLEQQVCNLELAKKLKELGVKQESLFWWAESGSSIHNFSLTQTPISRGWVNRIRISAFTVAELGEMLPPERYWTSVCLNSRRWRVAEFSEDGLAEDGKTSFVANNEADARAAMLIYLIETNLITL